MVGTGVDVFAVMTVVMSVTAVLDVNVYAAWTAAVVVADDVVVVVVCERCAPNGAAAPALALSAVCVVVVVVVSASLCVVTDGLCVVSAVSGAGASAGSQVAD